MKITIEKNKKKKPKITKQKSKKKKLEFFQKCLMFLIIISVIFTSLSYILSWFDKNPVETLSITIIQTLWSSTGIGFIAYSALHSVRAVTSSVWGIPNDNSITGSYNQTDISLQNLGDFSAKNDMNGTQNDMNNTQNTEYNTQNNRGT